MTSVLVLLREALTEEGVLSCHETSLLKLLILYASTEASMSSTSPKKQPWEYFHFLTSLTKSKDLSQTYR